MRITKFTAQPQINRSTTVYLLLAILALCSCSSVKSKNADACEKIAKALSIIDGPIKAWEAAGKPNTGQYRDRLTDTTDSQVALYKEAKDLAPEENRGLFEDLWLAAENNYHPSPSTPGTVTDRTQALAAAQITVVDVCEQAGFEVKGQ